GGTQGGGAAGGTDGKALFAGTCGSCHTLADAGTNGTFGPNLDELKPDADEVREAIRGGPDQMPENLLEGAQADAVAEYVASAAGG
ncbi:MAG TPA: cytochrome c, partial [Solirubrobacteraceae bacterium]|nr:cytochrome c [Solirubrobacteraceae bacterium]